MICWVSDREELQQVAQICQDLSEGLKNRAIFNWTAHQLIEEAQNSKILIKKDFSKEVVSFLAYRELPDSLEIMALGTRHSCLRQGFQGLLLSKLKNIAFSEKKDIFLEVHEGNHEARQLYQKWGFEVIGRRSQYYADQGAAVVMVFKSEKILN